MNFNSIQQKALEILKNAENKEQAIIDVFEMLAASKHEKLVADLVEEQASFDAKNYRRLTEAEQTFYKGIQQAVTFTQADVIPTAIIDRTLEDVRQASDTLKLVNMAPAGVKKWLTGSHTGTAAWGTLSGALTSELTATLSGMDIEVNKLYVLLVVPKAVRELALPLVDKYFRAILAEAMHDGLVDGFLNGTGQNAPIGIAYKLPNSSGAVIAKTVHATLKGFTPKDLAPVKKELSNNGKRKLNKLYVIANPSDVSEYIDPSLYTFANGAWVQTSKTEIEVIEEPKCPTSKAFITLDGVYTMGMSAVKVDEYKETKALDDADLFIAKCYANGRPDDDVTAYVFNPTNLEEFKLHVVTESAA